MFVAEVVERDGELRLRAIDDSREVYELEGAVALLARGAVVEAVPGTSPGRARVVMRDGAPVVYAAAGTGLASVYHVAARRKLRVAFSAEVMDEVATLVEQPGIDDPTLRDLTALPFVTIDYEESKDLDQALFVERHADGFRVYYALADGAFYVRPGTAVFAEAVRRATSFYLPGLTVPMLPTELSEGVVSLNEGVARRALVFVMTVASSGKMLASELVRARITSRAKLSYEGVQEMHDDPAGVTLSQTSYGESLRLLAEVGQLRIEEADARDVVRYDRVAARVSLSDDGWHVVARAEPRNAVQRWNEQISLMCNIEGAKFLTTRVDQSTGFAGVFRVHPPPEAERVAELASLISHLVDVLDLPERWRWNRTGERAETLADYVERLPDSGAERRLSRALQRQAMLINHPSFFTTEPGPHYGIGATAYSRFSSPMREMVGVVTEHIAFHQIADTPVAGAGLSSELIESVVEAGNAAKKVQKRISKEANKLAMDELFRADLDAAEANRSIRLGTVMGVSESKLYVQLDEPPVEIKIYADDIESDGRTLSVRNRFEVAIGLGGSDTRLLRVGDEIGVITLEHDRDRRRWLFRVT